MHEMPRTRTTTTRRTRAPRPRTGGVPRGHHDVIHDGLDDGLVRALGHEGGEERHELFHGHGARVVQVQQVEEGVGVVEAAGRRYEAGGRAGGSEQ